MSLFPIINILVQNTAAATPTEKKKLPPQGAAPGGYTNTEVVDAQVALLCSDPSTYGVLAIQSNEVQLVIGKPSAGSPRGYTVEYMRAHEEARIIGAASNADSSYPKIHGDDYSIDYSALKKARKALKTGEIVLSGGNLIVKGTVVTANPSAWGGSTTPSDEQLLGGVSNTVLDEVTGTFSPDAAHAVIQDSLRKTIVHADQGVKIKESAIIKDNNIREVVDEQDPVLGALDDVQAIVGGVKDFSISLDQAALKKGQYKLAVNGSIDWKAGGIDKGSVESIFKTMPGCSSLDLENELIAELMGGVIGYAVLSVLKAASGKGGAIDLAVVRQKALEVEGKLQGQPVIPQAQPAPVPQPTQAPQASGNQVAQRPAVKKSEGTLTYENAELMSPEYQLQFASFSVENGSKLLSGIQASRQRKMDEKALRGPAARGLITVLTRDFGFESGLVVTSVKGKKGDVVTFAAKGKVTPPQELYLISEMSLKEIQALTSYRSDLINGKVLPGGKKALPGTKAYHDAIIGEILRINGARGSDSEAFLPA